MSETIFVIGDSVSLAYGPFLEKALAPEFGYARKGGEREALRDLDIPRGANGGDSRMVRDYMEELERVGPFPYEVLLLNAGLHDIKRLGVEKQLQIPPADYRGNLEEIIRLGRRLGSRIFWVNTTPVEDELHAARGVAFFRYQADVVAYQEIASGVMKKEGIPMAPLDQYTASLGSGSQIFRDGVHFSETVAAKQGVFLAEWIYQRMRG